ncbi:cupin domain-containing protein [Paenibacillus sp. OV219]|uniref:cupin domain-containing protein n=1 Tax=Paenibacillus sp. OV219 TaxID=1884377 RepID=UPI0008CDC325|nr:cupin domain-containing protein [Paenibacillus sp. OV219]SEN51136.1 Cupin [Paenibacillus sp. OV219]
MSAYIDYTSPSVQYTFDVNKSPLFKKDANNFINVLGVQQLNSLENSSLLDIYLSAGNVVEPHYHQNAAELVYCISGAATVSMLNPFTKQLLNFPITPGQVANIPQGWWHYEIATADHTHLLAIFDAPQPEVILGSDILKFTPANVMSHTYCINEETWKKAVEPVKPSTYIGPYTDCNSPKVNLAGQQDMHHPYPQQQQQAVPYHHQYQQYQQYPYHPQQRNYWGYY